MECCFDSVYLFDEVHSAQRVAEGEHTTIDGLLNPSPLKGTVAHNVINAT